MRDFAKRLSRVEARSGPALQGSERWITDGDVSSNMETGETIPTAELQSRPLPEGWIRIIRNVVGPAQEYLQ